MDPGWSSPPLLERPTIRQWLYNLARQPEATVQFQDGRRVPVVAETLSGVELEEAWGRLAADAPEYVKYRSKTDREIPVVRLRPC